mmetsp:Transcript_6290/g.13502  ORF Transcript_6290/g.13502 Transcript_6290/m.13502 type:complete len:243 (+) Transcript_6290:684-1412(+)
MGGATTTRFPGLRFRRRRCRPFSPPLVLFPLLLLLLPGFLGVYRPQHRRIASTKGRPKAPRTTTMSSVVLVAAGTPSFVPVLSPSSTSTPTSTSTSTPTPTSPRKSTLRSLSRRKVLSIGRRPHPPSYSWRMRFHDDDDEQAGIQYSCDALVSTQSLGKTGMGGSHSSLRWESSTRPMAQHPRTRFCSGRECARLLLPVLLPVLLLLPLLLSCLLLLLLLFVLSSNVTSANHNALAKVASQQ